MRILHTPLPGYKAASCWCAHGQAEDQLRTTTAPDVVELWIGISGRKVDFNIVRRGFILADPVMHAIRERIKELAVATANIHKPLLERIGFYPELSPDWRRFLDDLLRKDDSWSFLVSSGTSLRPS